jgi:S-DNA-T family DNA segregation ATPase FtsK/SpoIIIE
MAPAAGETHSSVALEKPRRTKPKKLPPEYQKKFRVEDKTEEPASEPPPRDERLPGLDLLVSEKSHRPDERTINLAAGMIEKTLAEFGIPAKVIGFKVGPTVTQFALEPGFVERTGSEGEVSRHKVRVSQISALSRDLALALSAERLRIEAPVPGRPYVGVEVPNLKATTVRLRPILETEAFYKIQSPLVLGMGRDVSGAPVVADLASMPHLLIAGATGSGKSVCIAALATCLVMNNTPEDLRLVLVDPKMVELIRFNGLPHLYGEVETKLERILLVLHWTVIEMDRRYKLLEEQRVRDIDGYNKKMRRRKDGEVLPRIVVFIDELADLMMTAPDQTEHILVRLAQMARATGIHLVLATQRPSTDVVTGLIKANFPARLSFAVASSVDSRVILDTPGAESLLGRGDMLFLPPEAGQPFRAQGAIVDDQEIESVISYWKRNWGAQAAEEAPWEEVIAEEEEAAERDELLERAIEVVEKTGRASASMLQRRLRVGYPRAARLVDQLEKMGVVGPSQGPGKERDVFLEDEEEQD